MLVNLRSGAPKDIYAKKVVVIGHVVTEHKQFKCEIAEKVTFSPLVTFKCHLTTCVFEPD